MITHVLDASVAAKWFLPAAGEPLAGAARELLKRYAEGEVRFLVPDLFWCEFGSILWKATRQGRILPARARDAMSSMRDRGIPSIASVELIEEALAIAIRFQRTVYDSVYAAAAIAHNAALVTADERLANALAARLPVKWLGAV